MSIPWKMSKVCHVSQIWMNVNYFKGYNLSKEKHKNINNEYNVVSEF